ncbi:MAG: hypothetical protein Q8K59_06250 [Nitrosomonas sp.]|nr:hypothetical protein [Nitrosomonas sp.]MDP1950684.1 hypothetical protein [Nitrosomonas sp.]
MTNFNPDPRNAAGRYQGKQNKGKKDQVRNSGIIALFSFKTLHSKVYGHSASAGMPGNRLLNFGTFRRYLIFVLIVSPYKGIITSGS